MPTEIEGIKFYTITETAQALKVTPQTVRGYVNLGKIKNALKSKPILITENSIQEFIKATKQL